MSSPPASIVWVNAMWMMSLLLSLTSALFATMLQQWAHKYLQTPKIPSEPKQCARVRSSLFLGTQQHRIHIAVETASTLLHFSVFLFFVGLVIIFYTIHKTVAIIVTISVGIFVAAYVPLTIFPYIYPNSPYRTPMSTVLWYMLHGFLLSLFLLGHWLFELLHGCVVPLNDGGVDFYLQGILTSVLNRVEVAVGKHRRRLEEGLRKTIVRWALEATDIVDVKALTWWLKLPALAEESKAQGFMACIPKATIIQLVHDQGSKHVFMGRLLTLLQSCGPGSLAIGPDKNERKTRLLVCLHVINRIARDCVNQNSDTHVDFVRTNFANIGLMREMLADSDTGIRVTSRSICALLARCLLGRGVLHEPELRWLEEVTGTPSNTIYNAVAADRDLINLKSFIYALLADQDPLPAEHATSFTYTLAILMGAGTETPFDRTEFQEQLCVVIEEIEEDTIPLSTEVATKLRLIFQDHSAAQEF